MSCYNKITDLEEKSGQELPARTKMLMRGKCKDERKYLISLNKAESAWERDGVYYNEIKQRYLGCLEETLGEIRN